MQETTTAAAPSAQRVIKKYPNRRLYDTNTSSYITLTEVKQLVMGNEPVVVKDAKTGEDLTRSILLQIILEEEAGGYMGSYLEKNVQMFTYFQNKLAEQAQGTSPEAWSQFMRMQPPAMQNMMSSYMEQSQNMFAQMQEQMQKQTEQMLGALGIKRNS